MLKLDSAGNHTLITLSCADDPAPIRFDRIVRLSVYNSGGWYPERHLEGKS